MTAQQIEDLPAVLHALEIPSAVAEEMLDDPPRAYAVLNHAVYAPGILVPRAYAIALWREGVYPVSRSL